MDTKPIKKPNFIQAILVLGVIVAILMLSITVWDVTIQIALLISIIIASCFALFLICPLSSRQVKYLKIS